MKIAVIGTGYVGLVSGACLAKLGNNIICIDYNVEKIAHLNNGIIPIYEPGLEDIIKQAQEKNNLIFSTQLIDHINNIDAVILAVGTPSDEKTGKADLSYVMAATKQIAESLSKPIAFLIKSTVPVGTCRSIKKILTSLKPNLNCPVISNPEFLREGSAVKDFMHPDRILIGIEDDSAKKIIEEIYAGLLQDNYPLIYTNLESAELIKYASNAFLAMKTAFVNEIADLCEKTGANIKDISLGMGMDERIGKKHLLPGPGYGGSCFPKDTLALTNIAKQYNSSLTIVETVIKANDRRKLNMVKKIKDSLNGKVKSKKIAILGLTFKANTDDMRYSPALVIVPELIKMGAEVKVYDPVGMNEARKYFKKEKLDWAISLNDCITNADAIVILTEWQEFANMQLSKIKDLMIGDIIIDLRNIIDKSKAIENNFKYIGIGQ